jgi:hypothetical protein
MLNVLFMALMVFMAKNDTGTLSSAPDAEGVGGFSPMLVAETVSYAGTSRLMGQG